MEVIPTPALALIMAMPFLVALFSLHFILFKPLMQFVVDRQKAIGEANHEAETMSAEVETRVASLENTLAAARDRITTERNAARARANAQSSAILATARHTASERLDGAVKTIAGEQVRASAEMRVMAASLSADIVSTVLGRAQ